MVGVGCESFRLDLFLFSLVGVICTFRLRLRYDTGAGLMTLFYEEETNPPLVGRWPTNQHNNASL